MAKKEEPKERCPRCQGTIYATANDKSGKLYCQTKGCGNVWAPATAGMSRPEIQLKNALTENVALKAEITKVRAENKRLTEELEKLKPAEPPVSEAEIFS